MDLQPAVDAARSIALVEDASVFHGMSLASIDGIVPASAHDLITLDPDLAQAPKAAAEAVAALRRSGVDGPYAMALGNRCYTGVVESTHGGYPTLEHLKLVLDGGPVVWAPAVEGAVVLSTRGGDFELVVGEDFSIGYRGHWTTRSASCSRRRCCSRQRSRGGDPTRVRDHWIQRPWAREPGRRLGLGTRVLTCRPALVTDASGR